MSISIREQSLLYLVGIILSSLGQQAYAANDIDIISGTVQTNISGSPTFTSTDDSAHLGADNITGFWASNLNSTVSVSTGEAGTNTQDGNLSLSGDVDFNGLNDSSNTLNFSAHNDINIIGTIYDSVQQIGAPYNSLYLNLTPDSDGLDGGIVNLNGTIDKAFTTVTGNLNIGSTGVLNGTLSTTSVFNSGQVTSTSATITNNLVLNPGSSFTVGNAGTGTFTAGTVIDNGGSFTFSGSQFTLTNGDLAVNSNGLLGDDIKLSGTSGFQLLGVSNLSVGTASAGSGTFTVENSSLGAEVAGTLTINAGGIVNFQGGNMDAGAIDNSAGGQFNFTGGVLHLTNSGLLVGSSGLLGDNVTLANNKEMGAGDLTVASGASLTVSGGYNVFSGPTIGSGFIRNHGTTTMTGGLLGTNAAFTNYSGAIFNLNGGELSVGSFNNAGAFNFNSGTLRVNYSDLEIGELAGSGGSVSIGSSKNLYVEENSIIIGTGKTLSLNGGTIAANTIANSGTFNFNSGLLFLNQAVTIGSGGLFGNSLSLNSNRILGGAGSISVASGASLSVNDVTHGSYGSITNSGTVNIASGTLSAGNGFAYYMQSAGTTVVNGTLSANTVTISGGTLRGAGTIDANVTVDGGIMTTGNSIDSLFMSGALTLSDNGTLLFEIDDDISNGFIWDTLVLDAFNSNIFGTDFQGGEIGFSLFDGVAINDFLTSFNINDFFKVGTESTVFGGLFDGVLDLSALAAVDFFARDDNLLYILALDGEDGTFTMTSSSPVPIPPAFLLFGSGLIGLVGIARRRTA